MSKSILHEIVERSPELAESTRDKYLRDLDAWITFAGAEPSGWTRERAQAFYAELLGRMKPQSANRLMASVQYAARWYATNASRPELNFAVVPMSPVHAGDRAERHALEHEAAEAMLRKTFEDPTPLAIRDRALIVVGLETGMRLMSLRSMRLDGIHDRLGYPAALVQMKGQGKSEIPVPLSDTALKALDAWRQYLKISRGPVFRGLTKRLGAREARWTVNPTALSETAIQKIVAARSNAAGIGHVHPHMFRHTFVTWRASAGLAPHEVASITGHKIAGLGAIAGYLDMGAIARKVRESTPEWLRKMFDGGAT